MRGNKDIPDCMLFFHLLQTLFWIFVIPALAGVIYSIKTGRRFLEYVQEHTCVDPDDPEPGDQDLPFVTLIVPVKGKESGLLQNLRSLADLDYPDYELVISCCSLEDPALEVVHMVLNDWSRIVISNEPAADVGEKIHNLMAAVEAAQPRSAVFVFADSDGQVPANWLRKLVAPLKDQSLGAVTTYRWYFPEDGGFWPLLRSVWNSVIVTSMNISDKSFAWGGGMAIRRDVFESVRVTSYWRGSVSDDLRLTDAVRDSGLGIRFLPEAMVATTSQCTRNEFLGWAKRQLVIVKRYRFRLWLAGYISHLIYCGAQVLCLLQILQGNLLGLGTLILILLPGMAMGSTRCYASMLIFPDREDWFEHYGWIYFWMNPIATWIWMYTFVRSGFTNRINWRGRVYDLNSKIPMQCVNSSKSKTE